MQYPEPVAGCEKDRESGASPPFLWTSSHCGKPATERMKTNVGNRSTASNVPLEQNLYPFLTGSATTAEKVKAVQSALESADGKLWREELGRWAAQMVPVELLVPDVHREWRPLVREAILFVVSKLSAYRLAPEDRGTDGIGARDIC